MADTLNLEAALAAVERRLPAMLEDAKYEWGEACGGPSEHEIYAQKILSAVRDEVSRAATKAAAPADAHSRDCGNQGCTGCIDPDDLARQLAPAEDAREEVQDAGGQNSLRHPETRMDTGFDAGGREVLRHPTSVPAIPGTGREKEWISVTDKLPDPNGTYLVASNWGVRAAYLHDPAWAQGCWQDALSKTDEGEMDFDYKQKGRFKVTHWMPLPAAPSHPSEAKAGEPGHE